MVPGHRGNEGISALIQLIALVIVATLIAAAYTVFFAYSGPTAPPGRLVAEEGDAIEVDYIGTFESGRVFDTSIFGVAIDNATYPKSPGFEFRGSESNYRPLDFFVGEGRVVQGFDDGVLGMAVGETRLVTIPPHLGYGFGDAALRVTRTLVEKLPVTETITKEEFVNLYLTEAEPLDGSSVPNPIWGWNVTVQVVGDLVVTRQTATPGTTVTPYDRWDALVESVDDSANGGEGVITLRHLLAVEDVGAFRGSEYGAPFTIRSVDEGAGTWVQDFNLETVGTTLIFQITLVSLEKV